MFKEVCFAFQGDHLHKREWILCLIQFRHAELLAEVYINMTRGQDALLIDSSSDTSAQAAGSCVDFSTLVLSVLAANEQELQAHAKVLDEIDKASAGKTVWARSESTV